ncbi:PQQ-binding-like beta-propeller repeat protein [Rhodopirellula europaea]|uniref:Pyrrolo-quinoline quinone n=1 Tax=Rhodopirellula europaea SH398 TaxID=1263868 RepID=M5SD70_9BACT|nr:PQQ-binding-like beta-propeller repeat protein [Rhodopirellula europaea]EMI24084.1 Pyrrolo-quinoline quinone [Rhodopirellula europaea SH398]
MAIRRLIRSALSSPGICGQLAIRMLLLGTLLVCSGNVVAEDWPQWRGTDRDGDWTETGIVTELPEGQLPLKWSVEIGSGYSGPTVADGRVYVTDRQTEPDEIERVLCFAESDGSLIWEQSYAAAYEIGYRAGPRASVTIHDGKALAVGAMGHFHCFDAADGDVLWKHDLHQEYDIDMPAWGITGAPLVFVGAADQPIVIQIVGGSDGACVVGFDLATGKEVWRSLDERACYSAPILIQQGGKDVVVCWTGDSISGLSPSTGDVFWSIPFPPSRMPIGVATPVVDDNLLFVTSFYDGSMMVELSATEPTATKKWHRVGIDEKNTRALQSIISTPVMRDGYVYGVDSYGELRCLDAETGERVWEDTTAVPRNRWGTIHTVVHQQAGSQTDWMFNDQGRLTIAHLTPEGYQPLSQTHLLDTTTIQLPRRNGVTWSHPAYANRCIYARNDKQLVCASLEE